MRVRGVPARRGVRCASTLGELSNELPASALQTKEYLSVLTKLHMADKIKTEQVRPPPFRWPHSLVPLWSFLRVFYFFPGCSLSFPLRSSVFIWSRPVSLSRARCMRRECCSRSMCRGSGPSARAANKRRARACASLGRQAASVGCERRFCRRSSVGLCTFVSRLFALALRARSRASERAEPARMPEKRVRAREI